MTEYNRDEFIGALRTALMQLDDLPALRQNALLPLIAGEQGEATPSALQRALLTRIDELKGESDLAALKSAGVPAHEVLYYRYVEQLAQTDLAFQLGVSVRQLRRYQNSAIERLADLLCLRYGIHLVESAPGAGHESEHEAGHESGYEVGPEESAPRLDDEVASLQRGDPAAICALDRELERALAEAGVIADHYAITVDCLLPPDLPRVAAPPTLLRQVLLTLLTATLPHVRSLRVRVTTQGVNNQAGRVSVLLEGTPAPDSGRGHELRPVIDATTQLLAHFGGSVRALDLRAPAIELTIPAVPSQGVGPAAEAATLLVVDDNHDTRYLFRRYAAQTRYTLFDTDDLTQVIALARRHSVDAIIIDVMMPATDGWELLAQLRHHPATQNIPIIVCTVLPQQDLAYHLGVAGFMQKPIGRAAFLATLDRVLDFRAKTPTPSP